MSCGQRRANGDKLGRDWCRCTICVLDAAGGEERRGAFVRGRVAMMQAIVQLRRRGEAKRKRDGNEQ